MATGLKAMAGSIMVILALISIGVWERLLWVVTALYLWRVYKGVKKENNNKWKAIISGIVVGYLVMMALLGTWQYSIEVQHSIEQRYPSVHHVPSENVGVILLFEGESPTYELPIVMKKIREDQSLISQLLLPVHLFQEKIKYEKVERGSHVFRSQKLQGRLKEKIPSEFNLYVAYQNHTPFLEEVAYEAIKLGHSKLIFVPLTLSENRGFEKLEHFVRNLNIQQDRIKVKTTYPLWDSDLTAQSFLQQIQNQSQHQRRDNIGVILLGEDLGEGREGLQHVKQDLLFRQKLRDLMLKEGFHQDRIRSSHLDRKKIEREMEALMSYGVREIVVLQTAHLDREGDSRLLVKRAAKKAELPYSVQLRHIIGFEGNDLLIKELQQRIQLVNLQSW